VYVVSGVNHGQRKKNGFGGKETNVYDFYWNEISPLTLTPQSTVFEKLSWSRNLPAFTELEGPLQ
jgi:hypothetical protein